MPNWCSNFVMFHHDDERQISRLIKAAGKRRLLSDFVPMEPEPSGDKGIGHLRNSGQWGTKWEIASAVGRSAIELSEDGKSASFGFETASGPPIEWYEQLAGFTITAYYYEPGLDFCGKWSSTHGDTQFQIHEYESFEDVQSRIPEDIIDHAGIREEFDRRDEYLDAIRKIRKSPDNREAVLEAVNESGEALQYASENMRSDVEVVLVAVKENGWALKHASTKLRAMRKIALAAVSQSDDAMQFVDQKFRADRTFIVSALKKGSGGIYEYITPQFQDENDIFLLACHSNASCVEHASVRIRNSKRLLLEAVRNNQKVFRFLPKKFKDDADIVKVAIKSHENLKFVSRRLRRDSKIVEYAIKINPSAIIYAPSRFRRDRVVALRVVKKSGWLLEYFSAALRNDRAVVLAAVKKCGSALRYASPKVRADLGIVRIAVAQDKAAIEYASGDIEDSKLFKMKRDYLEELAADSESFDDDFELDDFEDENFED